MREVDLELIKQRRKELRITTKEMAEALGFRNASTYWKYENGIYRFKAEHIPIVANKLKLSVKKILSAA